MGGHVMKKKLIFSLLTLSLLFSVQYTDLAEIFAAATSPPEVESPQTGTGWAVEPTVSGIRITWTGESKLPVGAELLEVRRAGKLLGIAREQGRSAVLDLPRMPVPPLDELELWRSGRRLDTATGMPSIRSDVAPKIRTLSPSLAVQTSNADDPGTPGPYATERLDYTLEGLPWYEFFSPIEVHAEVTTPLEAPGARPLVLILHGFYETCFTGGPQGESYLLWPCPYGLDPIPSHRGYRVIADLLASQGAIVVSISANGINGQDWLSGLDHGMAARSALIHHHLGLWAEWAANGGDPWGGRFHEAVDLSRVVLVGHSRGGEGIVWATIDSETKDPWRIRGIVAIAPTTFARQVPPYVHTLVLLPDCDGNVFNLSGQNYVDGARDLFTIRDPALRSAALIDGANHAFFNSEWTPGQAVAPAWDDAVVFGTIENPDCMPESESRLAPEVQQAVAATYIAALVKLAVNDDPSMLNLLDGPAPAPPSALGAQVLTSALGGDRTPLYEPDLIGEVSMPTDMTAQICTPLFPSVDGIPSCTSFESLLYAPHWSQTNMLYSRYERPRALRLEWSGEGGTTRIDFDRPMDLRRFDRIDARFIIDQYDALLTLAVRLIDAKGHSADLMAEPIQQLPGGQYRRLWGQAVSVGLADLTGLTLSQIVAIELVFPASEGSGYLLDVMAVRNRLPKSVGPPIAKLDVPEIVVAEGNGPNTATLTVPITGTVRNEGLVWVEVRNISSFESEGFFRSIRPSDEFLEIPVSWVGDEFYSPFSNLFYISLVQHRDVLTRDYVGTVTIMEDDPAPEITIEPEYAIGTEVSGLTWNISMTMSMNVPVGIWFTAVPPFTGEELSVGDLDPDVIGSWCVDPEFCAATPLPDVPLSEAFFLFPFIMISPNETTATFHVPTITDDLSEGPETVVFQVFSDFGPVGVVSGTVSDN